MFLQLCPYCCPATQKKSKNKVPLKMILTPRIGHQTQIDLIDIGALANNATRNILRYVNHLSGFLDNGNEFLGQCIKVIKSFYPYIHIVKGRAYHPQSQGKVERGHAPFKEALQKWMAEHGSKWMIGVFIVNDKINQRAQWNRDNLSPYNMMYGKKGTQRNNVVFGEAAGTHAKSEYGVMCANFFVCKPKNGHQ